MQLTTQFVKAGVTSAGELDNVAALGTLSMANPWVRNQVWTLDQAEIGDSETRAMLSGSAPRGVSR